MGKLRTLYISRLFHIDVAEGKKDVLIISVLDLYKVILSEFLSDKPDLCCTSWGCKSDIIGSKVINNFVT